MHVGASPGSEIGSRAFSPDCGIVLQYSSYRIGGFTSIRCPLSTPRVKVNAKCVPTRALLPGYHSLVFSIWLISKPTVLAHPVICMPPAIALPLLVWMNQVRCPGVRLGVIVRITMFSKSFGSSGIPCGDSSFTDRRFSTPTLLYLVHIAPHCVGKSKPSGPITITCFTAAPFPCILSAISISACGGDLLLSTLISNPSRYTGANGGVVPSFVFVGSSPAWNAARLVYVTTRQLLCPIFGVVRNRIVYCCPGTSTETVFAPSGFSCTSRLPVTAFSTVSISIDPVPVKENPFASST
mmetsp:Transcript_863/g.1809  ORF Transcript_863/g.1809 Transcript_863/m.1809 type:complete len:296 (-) Transcript_863:9518-10405(-)